jgi:hypothetical protein
MNLFGSKKMKLAEEQYISVVGIANELGIPKEEVLWMFVELGLTLSVLSNENESLKNMLESRGDFPEYKHWQEITELQYKNWKAGELNDK